MQPSDEAVAGAALHARMLAGDRTASTEVHDRYNPVLVKHLRVFCASKNLPKVDDDVLVDAAVDALMSYLLKPERYDPSRGKTLAGYLKMAAIGDLKNHLTKRKPPTGANVVQLFDEDWNKDLEDPRNEIADAEDQMAVEETIAWMRGQLETDEERVVFDLLIAGERSNAVFAERIGLPDPTSKEAARWVNQIKDRIKKRFRRRGDERTYDAATD
jgi:hypothetical protein